MAYDLADDYYKSSKTAKVAWLIFVSRATRRNMKQVETY